MLTTPPAGRSKIILPDLDPIATKTSLVVRESPRFTPGGFMQSLLSAVVTGKASFNQLVGDLKDRVPLAMSRQSMHERIGAASTAFLMAVLSDLTKQRFAPAAKALEGGAIRRMLIEDASGQVMPKSNAEKFPAHGNHHGPTAGVKIDLAYDLLSGQVVSHSLHLATEQDKTIGRDLVDLLLPGDLVLRDMGYFSIGEFKIIEVAGAWWLTRLPLNVGVVLEDDTPIESTLKRSKQDIIDLPCKVGEEKKACRFVALRATREVAASPTQGTEEESKAKRPGALRQRIGARRLAPHADQSSRGTSRCKEACNDLPCTVGGGNPVPRLEAIPQPGRGTQAQERHPPHPCHRPGGNDRAPARDEDGHGHDGANRAGGAEL